eukprot:TRINITY_DN4127_c1_g1_i1.p1 TRINITY_DN4127_c1_g1~~TRINITY_DN4127_c1_g1_i1.p1  ORF type:complete len:793 (-),score=133.70 TRINITY_DN4127_c1_g1_i1:201-2579(-)
MEAPSTMEVEPTTNNNRNDVLKALVPRYFHQLTQGCGRSGFHNSFCASGGTGSIEPNKAAVLAFQLASTGAQNFCQPDAGAEVTTPSEPSPKPSPAVSRATPNTTIAMDAAQVQTTTIALPVLEPTTPNHTTITAPITTIPPQQTPSSVSTVMPSPIQQPQPHTPHLSIPDAEVLVATALATGEYTPVIRTIGSIFSTPDYLSISFLRGDTTDKATPTDPGLEYEIIEEFYKYVQQMPENVNNVLAGALGRLVGSLRRTPRLLTTPESLRPIMIALLSPHINEPSLHRELMNPLSLCIVNLSEASRQILIGWWTGLDADRYRQLLTNFRQYITMRMVAQGASLHQDEYIMAATKVIAMLFEVNTVRHYVNYTEFYNEVLDETLDIKDDFLAWRNKSGFSFCNYPMVLHPATKAKVLQLESLVQQQLERQATLQRTLFTGQISPPFLPMKIRRLNLIRDTLTEISRHDPADLKKELRVHFVGEEALDEGGVQKEFFQLILREIFDPKYGMFEYINETRVFWFNSNSLDTEEFELIGIILGLAVYNSVILDLHFPYVIYKKLMGITPTLEDLKDINPGLAKGLQQLLDYQGNVENAFDQNFQIAYEVFGERKVHDLKPGAENISLTNANRQEYVDLYVEYLLTTSVTQQFEAFVKGFRTVLSSPAFKLFRVEELELLICGDPVLDFEELERITVYDNGYSKNHPLIKDFWSLVHNFTQEQRKKLLFFSTGSDRAPIGGLGKLNFVISKHGPDSDRLPIAHTCFNHLLLPEYSTKEKLQKFLLTAIDNAEGFGMI